jgi:hypothetical protein
MKVIDGQPQGVGFSTPRRNIPTKQQFKTINVPIELIEFMVIHNPNVTSIQEGPSEEVLHVFRFDIR